MTFDAGRLYSVVEDSDGLHIVPPYRFIRGGKTLLSCASLAACGEFVAAHLAQIPAGEHGAALE
jgi:hypothetical protein